MGDWYGWFVLADWLRMPVTEVMQLPVAIVTAAIEAMQAESKGR